MSAAVMSPLGTMQEEEEAHDAIITPLVHDQPMHDDNDPPLLSDEFVGDYEMEMTSDKEENEETLFGGLVNLGNTCYLNSAIQMLASLESFRLEHPDQESLLRQEFLDIREKLQRGETLNPSEFKKVIDARSPLFVGYRQQDSHEFLITLLDLLDEDYKSKPQEDDEESNDVIDESEQSEETTENDTAEDDTEMSTALPAMPSRHSLFTPKLSRSLSELENDDISQLLHGGSPCVASLKEPKDDAAVMVPQCKLVGGRAALPMSGVTQLYSAVPVTAPEDELASAVPESTLATADEEQEKENREPTPIQEYFTTEVRATLICDSCKYTRSHVEKYLHLSLDIGTDSGSVAEGLRKFFAPENREIKCEKCFCETATQTLEISKLPRAFLVHCKRFLVDVSPDYSSITYRKNQSPFSFSDSLSTSPNGILGEFLAEDVDVAAACVGPQWALREKDGDEDMGALELSYRIRSVVNHIGSSASCGHYTCDASRLYPNGARRWTRFNDVRVSQVSSDDAMGASAQRTAYMIMYELE